MSMSRGCLAAVCLIAATSASAQVQYQYSGPQYTTFFAPYTASSRITGSFRTATALAANLANTDIAAQVQAFSFTDGQQTRTQLNSLVCEFRVSTDAQGRITGQNIWLRESATPAAEQQDNLETRWPNLVDQSGFLLPAGDNGCAAAAQDPFGQVATTTGPVWVGVSTAPVQLPLLNGWALGLLGGTVLLSAGTLLRRR